MTQNKSKLLGVYLVRIRVSTLIVDPPIVYRLVTQLVIYFFFF